MLAISTNMRETMFTTYVRVRRSKGDRPKLGNRYTIDEENFFIHVTILFWKAGVTHLDYETSSSVLNKLEAFAPYYNIFFESP